MKNHFLKFLQVGLRIFILNPLRGSVDNTFVAPYSMRGYSCLSRKAGY